MKLARYAPDDINTDKKKQRRFIKGFNAALREQIITHINPDFNILMNRTILLEEERNRSEGERKHKFLIQRACQQDGHNESAPTTPHRQGINQPCSIGHPDPTPRKPHPTTRTTMAAIAATTTSPRVTIIQYQKPILDAVD